MSSNSVSVSETPAATGSVAGVYDGRRVALLAQHGKERVIAQVLESTLGCRMVLVVRYDNIAGLQCASCGTPAGETRADVMGCLTCAYCEQCERTYPAFVDPYRCDYCNP